MKKFIRLQSQLTPVDITRFDVGVIYNYGSVKKLLLFLYGPKLSTNIPKEILSMAKFELFLELDKAHKETISIIDNMIKSSKRV